MVSAPVIVSGSEAVSAGDDDDYDEALTSSFSMSTVTNNHNKILMLAKSKLNSIETLISQALIGLEIRREDFKTIVKEKGKV